MVAANRLATVRAGCLRGRTHDATAMAFIVLMIHAPADRRSSLMGSKLRLLALTNVR